MDISKIGLRRVTSALLHEEVAKQLKELINSGTLVAGQHLSERQLGEQLGVSRTPLREALRSLAGEGLIELSPRKGARVARLRDDEIRHVFAVMEALEELAGVLACECMTAEELLDLRALHKNLVAAYRSRDAESFYALNQQIHEAILAASHNPVLVKAYQSLGGQMLRVRFLALNSAQQWREAVHEHEEIMAALVARDSQRLRMALGRHLQGKVAKVVANLSSTALSRAA